MRRHIDLDEDSVQHPTYVGSEAMGTEPGYALRRYLMEAHTEMRTINEIGSAPSSVDLMSRRTSHVFPELLPRSPQVVNLESADNTKWREGAADNLGRLMARDARDNTPMRNFHGLQPLMVDYTPYELPASPSVTSRTYNQKRNAEVEGFPTFQSFRSSLQQIERQDSLVELDNKPIDMTQNSSMGPFRAWRLPQRRVFGVSLEQLEERDGYIVPILVQKCVCAVRRFALGMADIYSDSFLERDAGFVVEELVDRFDHGDTAKSHDFQELD